MIKINLLESVTDRPTGVAMVEDKMANPRMQTLLLAITVGAILLIAGGYEYVSSKSAHETAQHELENQKRINQQMLVVNKEQADLEKKAGDIQGRIDAIKKLRESQQGPGSVLREIKARFDSVPELYLRSIEQKESELTIKGESPNENAVMRFGQSIEFSGGMFTNLNIETRREEGPVAVSAPSSVATLVPVAKPEIVSFVVKCNFTPKAASPSAANPGSSQVAAKK